VCLGLGRDLWRRLCCGVIEALQRLGSTHSCNEGGRRRAAGKSLPRGAHAYLEQHGVLLRRPGPLDHVLGSCLLTVPRLCSLAMLLRLGVVVAVPMVARLVAR